MVVWLEVEVVMVVWLEVEVQLWWCGWKLKYSYGGVVES